MARALRLVTVRRHFVRCSHHGGRRGIASFQTVESATVYSFGREVGTLRVNSSSPTDELTVTSEPGQVDYQLQIEMVLTDEYGGHHVTLNGEGSITAYDGASYYVDIVRDSSGTWVATLSPSGST
jgi:hypothetical protein